MSLDFGTTLFHNFIIILFILYFSIEIIEEYKEISKNGIWINKIRIIMLIIESVESHF